MVQFWADHHRCLNQPSLGYRPRDFPHWLSALSKYPPQTPISRSLDCWVWFEVARVRAQVCRSVREVIVFQKQRIDLYAPHSWPQSPFLAFESLISWARHLFTGTPWVSPLTQCTSSFAPSGHLSCFQNRLLCLPSRHWLDRALFEACRTCHLLHWVSLRPHRA